MFDNIRRQNKIIDRCLDLDADRKITVVWAVQQLGSFIDHATMTDHDRLQFRQYILQCIANKVSQVLQAPGSQAPVANLLEFPNSQSSLAANVGIVVARSKIGRNVPASYPRERLAAWLAIESGHPYVINDTKTDDRFSGPARSYRSILGVPIVRNKQAFAGLSIDHPIAYIFWGLEQDVELAITPYVGLLLLSYADNDPSHPCNYDLAHRGR